MSAVVLVLVLKYGGVGLTTTTIDMPSMAVCEAALKQIDDQDMLRHNIYALSFCLDRAQKAINE